MSSSSHHSSASSNKEREPLTRDYDFLETATQYLNVENIGFWRGNDDVEQSSLSSNSRSYPPSSAFHSPQRRRHYGTPDRSSDDTSGSGLSWNSANANSKKSFLSASLANMSGYMIPWQEEKAKPSSFDDEDEDSDESDEDPDEEFSNEPQDDDDYQESVVSKATTYRKPPGLCDILCKQYDVPVALVYSIFCLVVGLVALCFVIGYQSEHAQRRQPSKTLASYVLTPVAPPTPAPPTLAPTAMTAPPTLAPTVTATSQPSQCSNDRLTVDKGCYVSGDDGILLEFSVCRARESDWIGIYPISTTMLMDDYDEWSWSCGDKFCRSSPKSNDFVIDTERLKVEGTYRAYYMRYNNDGTPFASVAMSETFEISSKCNDV